MKRILIITALGLASVNAWCQGVIQYANWGPNLNAPVYSTLTGQTLSGNGFSAQLFGGKAGDSESALTALGNPVPFQDFGYFDGGVAINNFVLPGSVAAFQVRAWSSAYASYEQALAASLLDDDVLLGKSTVFETTTGISTPAVLLGLQSFSVAPIPEPSVWSLVGSGLVCGWFFLRRK